MTHFGKPFREWDRVLGLLTAAGLLVVAIVGVFLSLSLPTDDASATRSTGPSPWESTSAEIGDEGYLARSDAGPASSNGATSKTPPRPLVKEDPDSQNAVEVRKEGDEAPVMSRSNPLMNEGENDDENKDELTDRSGMAPDIAPAPPLPAAPATVRFDYAVRIVNTPTTAAAQAKLARWCEQNELKDEAKVHWEAVTRLDPKNEIARKRLGYKKINHRWMTDAMIAEEAEQAQFDKRWKKVLEEHHKRLHAKGPDASKIQDVVEAELAKVDDPRAVPMLWQVFAADDRHHLLLAGLLGRIKSPKASRFLAALSVYSNDVKARDAAREALRGRDPSEFAEPLIALVSQPLKYRTTTVFGLGGRQMKVLEVEDEQFNRQLVYAILPNQVTVSTGQRNDVGGNMINRLAQMQAAELNAVESRKATAAAEMQLKSDIAVVEEINGSILAMNDRVVPVLTAISNADHGSDRKAWERWLGEKQGRLNVSAPPETTKPTITQIVQPLYQPTFVEVPPLRT